MSRSALERPSKLDPLQTEVNKVFMKVVEDVLAGMLHALSPVDAQAGALVEDFRKLWQERHETYLEDASQQAHEAMLAAPERPYVPSGQTCEQ